MLLCAGGLPAQQASEASGSLQETKVSEIGLATGKVFAANIIRRDKKELIYRLPGAAEEKRLPLDEVIFIRSAQGAYEFIFPDEKPAGSQPAAAPQNTSQSETETLLLVGVGVTLSDNSALTAFARDYAGALAADYNSRLTPAGFVAQPGLEAGSLGALFSAEYRWLRGDYMLGLGAGYTVIPKSSAVVSSAAYSGQETINVDGYAVPVTAIVYYRLWGDRNFGLHMGAGGGALFTSVLVTRNFGGSSGYEEARGFAPMLVLRPELSLRAGPVTLVAAIPVFWAEGRPVGGDITATEKSGRAAAASFTGAGFMLSVGYGF
ncbi:MAG: hypothetical protein ACOY5B_09600 [Spirochaetota bacterium]